MSAAQTPLKQYQAYKVHVDEYVTFRKQGFLVIKGLIPPEDVQEMNTHVDHLLSGEESIGGARVMRDIGKDPRPDHSEDWLRVHMLHRRLPIHERFLLHPRVLDVMETLIGPDVLALQSMLFFKQPGQPGQGYHQDAYYIPTFPDTLCGAWLALSPATIENGCLWFTPGSQNEPIYPDTRGLGAELSRNFDDLGTIENASNTDETVNGLTRVAAKYAGQEIPVEAEPGDVVFFGGHILHRSHTNHANHSRRSFVGHYCNARSWVPWNHGEPYEGESGNYLHILARGRTHLPYAQPIFGTPCAANQPAPQAGPGQVLSMMGQSDGSMGMMPHGDKDIE